ncbi:EF-hand calcium-binding domain-containing protein 6 isoform X3 [Buteo buteo]|uniref:EF-hand calcium-binding domain-containing protein 6 isoform X3 n=1 Tax=Buteo buteo TaxID=30397 RepID=UPI003EBEC8B4
MLLMVLTRFLGGHDSCKQYQQSLSRKTDKFKRKVINQWEFQAATECRFGVEITDEEFELLLDRIPLDEDGNVRYPQFMARFDSWYAAYAFCFSFSLSSCFRKLWG